MSVSLMSLWLPIVLSAVAVFVASSLVWMVLAYHNHDWKKLPDEGPARDALSGVGPGQYTIPHAADNKAREDEEWLAKCKEGPNAFITVLPSGMPDMGPMLGKWFVYCLVISGLVAYVAGATLTAGAPAMKVLQVTSLTAFLAYGGGAAQGAIWFGHTRGRALRDTLDGLIYGLITAGLFAWLWPAAGGS